jgi:hypothetical protein
MINVPGDGIKSNLFVYYGKWLTFSTSCKYSFCFRILQMKNRNGNGLC